MHSNPTSSVLKLTTLIILLIQTPKPVSSNTNTTFPSLNAGWILPGYAEDPTDDITLLRLLNSTSVEKWEMQNADICYGGNLGNAATKKNTINQLGYIYLQALSFDPSTLEMALKQKSLLDNRTNYEDFFMHYVGDTEYRLPVGSLHLGSLTSLYGRPWLMGYNASPDHSGFSVWQKEPYGLQPFQYSGEGYFYVMQFEKFDGMSFELDAEDYNEELVQTNLSILEVEYVAETSTSRIEASKWKKLNLTIDKTSNLCNSGKIHFNPPSDWKLATFSDGGGKTYGSGQFFGNALMKNGGIAYAIRMRLSNLVDSTSKGPILNKASINPWIRVNSIDLYNQTIPGWNSKNDKNGDGYVDDDEFSNLVDSNATARMIHESRALRLGKFWGERSSPCHVNAWNEILPVYYTEFYENEWKMNSLSGAYNDDIMNTVGSNGYKVVKGGYISEFPNATIQSEEILLPYSTKFVQFFRILSDKTKKLIGGNISGVNLFKTDHTKLLITALDVFLQEDYLKVSIGFTVSVYVSFTFLELDLRDIKSIS